MVPGRSKTIRGEYPRLVSIETTNYCNATCSFCPNSALARTKEHMTDQLFDKIVEDCREFPLKAIEPFLQGEPFSDPKILDRMEKIRSRLPDTRLRFYSNGFAMTPRRIDRMAGMGIDHLFVSLNTVDPVKYRQVMGLRLERTLENLAYLTDPVRRRKVARTITFRMTRMEDTSLEEQDRFVRYCRERGVKPSIHGLFNYKGDVHSDLPVPDYPCEHVSRVDVLTSGRVALCCMDHEGEYSWGDVRRESVLEVYRGKTASWYRMMQQSGRRREAEPCGSCTHYWPGSHGMPLWSAARSFFKFGCYYLRNKPYGRRAPQGKRPAPPSAQGAKTGSRP